MMLCKKCRDNNEVVRGVKQITCLDCNKEVIIGSNYNAQICNDCSDDTLTCIKCGSSVEKHHMTNYEKILTLSKKEFINVLFKQGMCYSKGGCLAKSKCRELSSDGLHGNYNCYDYFECWLDSEYDDIVGFEDNKYKITSLN